MPVGVVCFILYVSNTPIVCGCASTNYFHLPHRCLLVVIMIAVCLALNLICVISILYLLLGEVELGTEVRIIGVQSFV